jgi:hypothetical protein
MWYVYTYHRLQSICEKDPGSSLSYIDFYDAYLDYSGKNDLDSISQPELLKLVVKIVGDACISSQPPLILGLRPPEEEEEEEEEEMQVERGYNCLVDGKVFESVKELLDYVLSLKLTVGEGVCPWGHCGLRVKSVSRHVLSHIPLHDTEKVEEEVIDEIVDEELKGIQLTSLLVIRNLARHSQNLDLFAVYEKDLAGLLTSNRYAKTVSMVFAEIGKHKY